MSKQLNNKIKNKSAKIAIIGLGYVGLELATTIAKSQFQVYGFDKNKDKINLIKKNKSPINTISSKKIKLLNKKFILNLGDIQQIYYCDVIIIALPTPLTKNDKPDISYLKNCYKNISPYLRHDQMIILESTVYPGCTEEECVPILEDRSGLKFNSDFYCGYSPERINPGDKKHTIDKIIKIYGLDEVSLVSSNTKRNEALSALETLGFARKQVEKICDNIVNKNPNASAETIIKQALKNL